MKSSLLCLSLSFYCLSWRVCCRLSSSSRQVAVAGVDVVIGMHGLTGTTTTPSNITKRPQRQHRRQRRSRQDGSHRYGYSYSNAISSQATATFVPSFCRMSSSLAAWNVPNQGRQLTKCTLPVHTYHIVVDLLRQCLHLCRAH